jgi:hypothetical protein
MLHRFSPSSYQPTGWLARQLRLQADGLSGHLDLIWPDIRDSAWIGGNKDGWERVPYWLDGFIPLAYLLRDKDLKKRAKKYIDGILERQCEDGWICPCSLEARKDYDVWAYQLIGKVLALWCEFNPDDTRAQDGLYRAMKCLYEQMKVGTVKLKDWGKFRWFESLISISFLYEKYPEEWLLDLARLQREQGADFVALKERWIRPLNIWTLETHVVNLCMMIKYGALVQKLLGEGAITAEETPEAMWHALFDYNGTAVGTITGDECLAGHKNTYGTELCSVAELMFSYEEIFAATGDNVWADRLEKAAFNALPAAISEDMWTHQYDQQVNQIATEKYPNKPIFRTNNGESGLFGLEPGYGCCTANFNQAWPKFAMNVFMTEGERDITVAHLLPSVLTTEIDGVRVKVEIITDYPFRHTATIRVRCKEPVAFKLRVRVPAWAKSAKMSTATRDGDYLIIDKTFGKTTTLSVKLTDKPHLVDRPCGSKVAEYGPLVFALPIEAEYKMLEYTRDGVERKFPYCDYELSPKSEWRYGFASATFEVVEADGCDVPFSEKQPSLALKASMARVDWDYEDGYTNVSAEKPVSDRALSAPEDKLLIPYGATMLRVTEMVKVKK